MRKHLTKTITICLLTLVSLGVNASGKGSENKAVHNFIDSDVGKDLLVEKKFVPPYDYEPMHEFLAFCDKQVFTGKHRYVAESLIKEEALFLAAHGIKQEYTWLGLYSANSGGKDVMYSYMHGDAAYLADASGVASNTATELLKVLRKSPSYNKVQTLIERMDDQQASLFNGCLVTDMLAGLLGADTLSRIVYADTANHVKRKTMNKLTNSDN